MKAYRILTAAAAAATLIAPVTRACAQSDMGGGYTPAAWEMFRLDPKVRVTLDFRNASVDAVIKTLSQASGVAIVKDPTLTTPITLQSPKQQTLKDAFSMLNVALELRDYDLEKEGNFLVIRARKKAAGGRGGMGAGFGSSGSSGLPSMASIGMGSSTVTGVLKVYGLQYASATQVAKVLNDVFASATDGASDSSASGPGGSGGPGGFGGPDGSGGPGGAVGPGGGTGGPGGPGGFGGFGGRGGFGGFGRRTGNGNTNTGVVKASADEYTNSVIVNAPSRLQDQIAALITQLDRQTDQPLQSRIFPLQYATASDLVTVVQNVLTNNAPKGRGATSTASTTTIDQRFQFGPRTGSSSSTNGAAVADERTNSIVATSTPDTLEAVAKVIKELDKPVTYESTAFVITLANARADDVADLINNSFSSTRSTTSSTSNRTNTTSSNSSNRTNSNSLGSSLRNNSSSRSATRAASRAATGEGVQVSEAGDGPSSAALGTQIAQFGGGMFGGMFGGGNTSGRSSSSSSTTTTKGYDASGRIVNIRDLTGQVTAIADVNTNSVIVVTAPQYRDIVQKIVDQLDKIPEQVMIETLIVEATLDATDKLGVEWSGTKGKSTGSSSFGLQKDTTEPQGFRYTLTGTQYNVFLTALQTDSRYEVLSTPRIFTSNNSSAEINISQSLPYVTNQTINTDGNYAYSYDFMDVGIVLTVTPRITSNGYVTMDVTQTANDFVRYTDFNAPVTNTREATTTVSVMDGETAVLGGIIQTSVSNTTNKVPLLGDIPVLGTLFRSTSQTKNKTELLVFLTPRIVRDPDEARRLREQTTKQIQTKSLEKLLKSSGADSLKSLKSDTDAPNQGGDAKPADQGTSPDTKTDVPAPGSPNTEPQQPQRT